jgi:rhodanese-related sulfurtransferase
MPLRRIVRGVLRRVAGSRSTQPTQAEVRPAPAPRSSPAREEGSASGANLANIEAGAQEVKERIDAGEPVVVLDVRQPEEVAAGIIAGARHIPLPELEARWGEVKDCDEVVCVCAAGGRSLQAAGFLRERGVFNATSMVGGMGAWLELGGTTVAPGG